MADGLIETAAAVRTPTDNRIYGVTVATVVDNIDLTGQGRVQVRLPWLPGIFPWARVAVPMAGPNRGMYFIPQEKDEVLVAFNHGDIREPYIIGSLWNAQDRPPVDSPQDAVDKCVIRTPRGHRIELDDKEQSITITGSTGHKITIEPKDIKVETAKGTVKVSLEQESGNTSVEAKGSLTISAENITLDARNLITIRGRNSEIDGGEFCDLHAGTVKIN